MIIIVVQGAEVNQNSGIPTHIFGFLAELTNFPGSARQGSFDRFYPIISPKFI
jgi:hypothetical protein